jgi:hypothetical protein
MSIASECKQDSGAETAIGYRRRWFDSKAVDIDEGEAIQLLTLIDTVWETLFPAEQASVNRTLIERITISSHGLELEWKYRGVARLLTAHRNRDATLEAA